MSAALSTTERQSASDLAARAAVAATVWDHIRRYKCLGGEGARLAAVVENVIAAIQGTIAPSEWADAGDATCVALRQRIGAGSAVAAVLGRTRPDIARMGQYFRADLLGTDAVGRGAGWHKTANCAEMTKAIHDAFVTGELSGGEAFRALKDIVVAALQNGVSASEREAACVGITREIARRLGAG